MPLLKEAILASEKVATSNFPPCFGVLGWLVFGGVFACCFRFFVALKFMGELKMLGFFLLGWFFCGVFLFVDFVVLLEIAGKIFYENCD